MLQWSPHRPLGAGGQVWCLACGRAAGSFGVLMGKPCGGWVRRLPAPAEVWLLVPGAWSDPPQLGEVGRGVARSLLQQRLVALGLAPARLGRAG